MVNYNLKTIACFILLILFMSGCNAHTRELKSPCGPSAGLSKNPCNPLPVNVVDQFQNLNVNKAKNALS